MKYKDLANIKTFVDRENSNKKFYHVKVLGLKFRVETYKRSKRLSNKIIYSTNSGIVFNLLPKRYFRFMRRR